MRPSSIESGGRLLLSVIIVIVLFKLLLFLTLNINPNLIPILIDKSPLLSIKVHRRLALLRAIVVVFV